MVSAILSATISVLPVVLPKIIVAFFMMEHSFFASRLACANLLTSKGYHILTALSRESLKKVEGSVWGNRQAGSVPAGPMGVEERKITRCS